MTIRTSSPQPSPIETATADIVHDLNSAITHEHQASKVPIPERAFRAVLAGYFERQSLKDWCELLGIEVPEGDRRQ